MSNNENEERNPLRDDKNHKPNEDRDNHHNNGKKS